MADPRIDGNNVFHDISFTFHEAGLESIGKELDRTLHTDEDLTQLTMRCDSLRGKLQSPESKAQLASYYGRLDTLRTDNAVDRLVDTTCLLVAKRTEFPQEKMTAKVGEIQSELARLWYDNALSMPNRRFIRIVVYNLNQLQVFPSSKTADVLNNSAHIAYLSKDQDMLPETELRTTLIDAEEWESAEFAFDLCEMAHCFYQNKINEGMKKLHQLTPSQKNRLEEICLALGAEYPDHFIGKDLSECQKDIMLWVQALVGYANEVAQGEPLMFFPSEGEIHMMFREVETLDRDE
ncbi:hypothetical protein [Simkania negevensis]|uniref:Uncharacterized protein n=1 Tax=Simkania negevensis (strain ATCC VR-1471 / DSM 27360 / Z) TaxID=331113 RepID=F8L5F4_SIMNZ|nr:hypothetical protein [Simkania negevensis]MCB1068116.1 hypothetical protein [Simkania sp.]MCB1074873.1 hypothetical protein [Simkania sp.]MCP5490422.1 hypothetical protein [Chlamydiales bacterium]CCB89273.1 unknown protein [Simkania negevensis Z]